MFNFRELIALNIYLGLCYYKLDYYDISQEALDTYLLKYPDSIIAINLKSCNRFRLANGRAAENELKNLIRTEGIFGADLIKHNLVCKNPNLGFLIFSMFQCFDSLYFKLVDSMLSK